MAIGIVEHIEACNGAGRLALVVYLLYGYPSAEVSEAAFELLKRHRAILECGLPVSSMPSSSASSAIVEAHNQASHLARSDEALLSFYARYRPNFLAHMRDEGRRDTNKLLRQIQGRCDAVMTDYAPLAATISERAARGERAPLLIQTVSALSEAPERDFSVHQDGLLIHLGVSSRIGGDLLPLEQIQTAVDKIVQAAPHAKILCGFGVRSAADVAYIRRLRGVHGVTVATEALRRLARGLSAFASWLEEIDRELTREYA